MNLENYGGKGWGYPEDNGSFEVRYEDTGKDCLKKFTLLSEAKEFYDSLDCERFAWDLTHGAELIDGMYIKHKNNE